MGRRWLPIPGLTAAAVIMAAALARAMPPWTCELSTTHPVIGEPVRIEVHFWKDADHTKPARLVEWVQAPRVFPRGAGGSPERTGALQMWGQLRRIGRGVYMGHLVFEDAYRYHVLLCGDRYDAFGYMRRSVLVKPIPSPGRSGSRSSDSLDARTVFAIEAILGITGVFVLRRLSQGRVATPEAGRRSPR